MAPTHGEICTQHLEYMKWADNLLLEAVQTHMPGRTEVLGHIFSGERIWLARMEGDIPPSYRQPVTDPAALEAEWPELHRKWLEWAADRTDWDQVVSYRMTNGMEGASPVWQIVLHVANHGSYHRGQVAAMLRGAGFTPPSTDLMRWYLR